MPNVVTANNLRSGFVVYLAGNGRWVDSLERAAVVSTAGELKDLEAVARSAVARTEVVSVYAMPVRVVDGLPVPLSARETIRAAHAPSI